MKAYLKPELITLDVVSKESLSSLSAWLEEGTGSEYQDAGITTYIIES